MEINLEKEIETVSALIRQGWILYGSFMDAGQTNTELARAVRYTIDRLEKAQANLKLANLDKVHSFIKDAEGVINGSSADILPDASRNP